MAGAAATKLEKRHADQAAPIWWAQASQILKAKRSKHYGAALAHLERAKRCYEKTGLHAQWQEVVAEVYAKHSGLRSFMPGFEALLGGSGPSDEPSFLDRAKHRWATRYLDAE